MENIGFFDRLMFEIGSLAQIESIVYVGLLFYIPFHFSKKAQSQFFHLLYSYLGIYMLFTMSDERIIFDMKFLVGIGLLIPQIHFIIQFTQDSIQTLRMMTANTYYFFITIYYKILRFIDWIKSTFIMLKIFFTTFSFKKEDYYREKQDSRRDYQYEQKYQNFEEESKYEEKETDYQEETKSESKEQSYTQEEPNYQEQSKPRDEFKQFYSDSAYVVLGVSADDDYKTIKKVYRKLVREYHPDLNPDNIKLYTEITQNINNAWEKVERWKK